MGLVGNPVPRLFTPPLRPLTPATTNGFAVAEFAREIVGEPLLPWQGTAVNHALELNEDGTYRFRVVVILVARQNGKSHLLRTVSLYRMYCDDARLVVGAAQDLTTAREVWQATVDTAKSVDELSDEVVSVRYANGEQTLTLDNGSRYIIKAATRSAGRGLSVDQLNLDEVREWRDWDAWSALSKTTSARRNGQIWVISNAGDDQSVVLNHLRETALSGSDPSICILEWSAPDGCDLDDEEAWRQANPGLGHTVSEQSIRTALATDPPAVFRTEVLCQHVRQLDEAIDLNAWNDCGDPQQTFDSVRGSVVAGIDVAPDGQHVTLVVAASSAGLVRLEVAGAWSSTTEARKHLPELLSRIKPRAVAWFPNSPAAALGPELRKYKSLELSGLKVAEACQSFADLVVARKVRHNKDPLLSAQISMATRIPSGDGWRFARRGGVGHVDAVYAAAGAVHAAQSQPSLGKPRLIVLEAA